MRVLSILCCLCFVSCGADVFFEQSQSAIINGSVDYSAEHMGVVYIHDGTNICTGTLIADDLVLTAAHCLEDESDLSWYEVGFGSDYYYPDDTREVIETQMHPDYNGNHLLGSDIGIIRLDSGAPSGIKTFPVLPKALEIEPADEGSQVTVLGFGSDEYGDLGTKRVGTTKIDTVCEESGGCLVMIGYPGWAANQTFCFGQEPSGTCMGDSGGPAFVERDGIKYIAGVHSYVGDEDCTSYTCSTSVAAYLDFLGNYIEVNTNTEEEYIPEGPDAGVEEESDFQPDAGVEDEIEYQPDAGADQQDDPANLADQEDALPVDKSSGGCSHQPAGINFLSLLAVVLVLWRGRNRGRKLRVYKDGSQSIRLV
jgi:hypothetical protein